MDDEAPDRLDDPWLTLAEIAEELRMSPATIRSWISKGTLRAMRAGQRKWLVRRSELDRMLGGEDFEDAPSPPPDPPAPGRRRRQRRFPDTITPPSARPWASAEGEEVDREEWLAVVQWEWRSALRQSEMAPPDAWFPVRLQLIAEAAARKAAALALFPPGEQMRWDSEPEGLGLMLSYELRPEATRPGPVDLWTQFDSAVGRLGIAMQSGEAGLIRRSLEDLSVTLHDIAESLDHYRGRYGSWEELQPPDEADGDTGDGSPDPPEATE